MLGEVPIAVTTGTQSIVRLEHIGSKVRLSVGGNVLLSVDNVASVAGQVGLVTYKASASFDDFKSYRP